jgi:hypothetical protein
MRVNVGHRRLATVSSTQPITANLQWLGLSLVDKGLSYYDPLIDKSLIFLKKIEPYHGDR